MLLRSFISAIKSVAKLLQKLKHLFVQQIYNKKAKAEVRQKKKGRLKNTLKTAESPCIIFVYLYSIYYDLDWQKNKPLSG